MRPFNLEEALAGKPVVTRDGRAATEIHYFKTLESNSRVVAVVDGSMWSYRETGRLCTGDVVESNLDLFMATQKVTKWGNVYKAFNGLYDISFLFDNEDEAVKNKTENTIVTVPITFEI